MKTTFADVPVSLRNEFAGSIGMKWREVAAQLNLPSCIITGSLPAGYCPNDCAKALVQWMADKETPIEDALRALRSAGIARLATEYGPKFHNLGTSFSNDCYESFSSAAGTVDASHRGFLARCGIRGGDRGR